MSSVSRSEIEAGQIVHREAALRGVLRGAEKRREEDSRENQPTRPKAIVCAATCLTLYTRIEARQFHLLPEVCLFKGEGVKLW